MSRDTPSIREQVGQTCATCGNPKSNHHYRHPFVEQKWPGRTSVVEVIKGPRKLSTIDWPLGLRVVSADGKHGIVTQHKLDKRRVQWLTVEWDQQVPEADQQEPGHLDDIVTAAPRSAFCNVTVPDLNDRVDMYVE